MSQVMTQGPSAVVKQSGPCPAVAAMPTINKPTPGLYMVPGGVMGKAAAPMQPSPHPVVAASVHQMPPPAPMPVPMASGMPTPAGPGVIVMSSTATSTSPAGQVTHQVDGVTAVTGPGGVIILSNGTLNGTDSDPEGNNNLANTKEKTPMCLINELARYNKIQHQYTLTDEQGPAHKKTFYVKLKLGDEEYEASGQSIKKAQHAAAAIALEKTQHKHPPPKPPRKINGGSGVLCFSDSITPTVELNALVMKRGEPAIYRPMEMQRHPYYPPPNLNFRGMYNQRYHFPRCPRVFYVSLKVGQREFIGEGTTRQAARHNAAAKALKVLRHLPLPNQDGTKTVSVGTTAAPSQPPAPPSDPGNGQDHDDDDDDDDDDDSDDEKDALKSEISLVHEIALKRNLPVNFEVVRESGPPHMRTFVTHCTVGDFVTEGEGNGKKISKKRAAEKMLEELKKLPNLPASVAKPKRNPNNKKKNRNLIKVNWLQKADPNYGVGINPISRLIQIQQAKREKEPVYALIAEKGMPRRREFVMEVQVGEQRCTGVGPNKKLAKRNAAEAMLQQLGYSRPSPQPSKPAIKQAESQVSSSPSDKKVTFVDTEAAPNHGVSTGRQLVPGLLLMPDGARTNSPGTANFGNHANPSMVKRAAANQNTNAASAQTTAAIAKELLDTGSSPTAESMVKAGTKPATNNQSAVRPKQQLLYLATVLGFTVNFTDFPKGSNKNEYLSLVSLSTTPPQVCHGAGPTTEESHDLAALTALKALAELGLDSVSDPKMKQEDKPLASGDGPHVKTDAGDAPANSDDPSNKTLTADPK